MDKKSKEVLRRYKKARLAARQRSSSDSSSSSSDSDSSYSSASGKNDRRRKKKAAARSSSRSSSGEERRKREKREHCQKKLEAKRNHLKRKLKEAKLKKRAAVAAAVLSGHSHRSLSPNTQAKLKKLAERKHLRAQSKERREREREKLRERERERAHAHQDGKRQKTPPRMHQMLSREKIIIQARTRSQTPSAERERIRHEQKIRHEDIARERERRERERERAEREAARDKERAEALARCQERQRERERKAREKLRREEEEKKYAGERGERMLPRTSEREIGSRAYNSRERSMDSERGRHGLPKRDIDPVYEREREYMDVDRHGILDREDLRREREDISGRRRYLSPGTDAYAARIRDPRELYEEDRPYGRPYLEEPRHPREREAGWLPRDMHERDIREPREFRGVDHDIRYAEERERELLMRERTLTGRGDWKTNWTASPTRSGVAKWEDGNAPHTSRSGFVGGPKRAPTSTSTNPVPNREQRANSEPDWDAGESAENASKPDTKIQRDAAAPQRDPWVDHDHREPTREKPIPIVRPTEHIERRWPGDWRENEETGLVPPMHHRSDRGGRGGFRRGLEHGYRGPPPLMTLPVQTPGIYGLNPRFPNKRNMTYTNPNLIKKQQALAAAKAAAQASVVAAATTAVAAAKAAAQSSANSSTNPSILGQVTTKPIAGNDDNDKPEAGEILPEQEESETSTAAAPVIEPKSEGLASRNVVEESKASGELSEISDSDDDILNKGERKSKSDLDDTACEDDNKLEEQTVLEKTDIGGTPDLIERSIEDDEMLDFEEISDCELEEEARHKGVGDALGVDWASLIEETKRTPETSEQPNSEQSTTAKQKWQPHRILLDIGVSFRMAGEEFAKSLIADAQQKLQDEIANNTTTHFEDFKDINDIKDIKDIKDFKDIQEINDIKDKNDSDEYKDTKEIKDIKDIKIEIKEEPPTPTAEDDDDDSQATTVQMMDTDAESTTNSELEKKLDIKSEIKSGDESNSETNALNVEQLYPLACSQVAERKRLQKHRQLFANLCGPNSRALSARNDLKLRRQLCGLPSKEPNIPLPPPAVSENMKAMALGAFKRTLEV